MKLVDMSRGKPSPEQLSLSNGCLPLANFISDGIDARNYGLVDGLPAARRFFTPILQAPAENIIAFGNSSLTLMYLYLRWSADACNTSNHRGGAKCIVLTPGYDRHFAICEELGIELISVPLLESGPDIEKIKEIITKDDSVIGMWCVPRFSNPTGITYTDEVVSKCAELPRYASKLFTIFWDNAYGVHHIDADAPPLRSIFSESTRYGTEDNIAIFGSTSKITFAGGGVAAMALSLERKNAFMKHLSILSIGPDKLSQLRLTDFLPTEEALHSHMGKHAAILRPKFDAILDCFNERLRTYEGISWSNPKGGYFISLNLPRGTASSIRELALRKGITLTPSGAAFTYGLDPNDSHLRIAPSYPSIEEISHAATIICDSIIEIVTSRKNSR